jgi:nitroimidazol reductase NimA-like FMN-containing flavoprotein (pyridoxamine 5'-phosphate oxidase superfamily)
VTPLNYIYRDGKIYFHCAKEGHKIDNIRENPRVCFTVVGEWRVVPEKNTTVYRSVVAFGRARIVEDFPTRYAISQYVMGKYSPEGDCTFAEGEPRDQRLCAVEIAVETVTGKENQR